MLVHQVDPSLPATPRCPLPYSLPMYMLVHQVAPSLPATARCPLPYTLFVCMLVHQVAPSLPATPCCPLPYTLPVYTLVQAILVQYLIKNQADKHTQLEHACRGYHQPCLPRAY